MSFKYTSETRNERFTAGPVPMPMSGAEIYFMRGQNAQFVAAELVQRQVESSPIADSLVVREGRVYQRCKKGGKKIRLEPVTGAVTAREYEDIVKRSS